MKRIEYVFLLSYAFQLQAMSEQFSSNSKDVKNTIEKKSEYTWNEQLIESIEEGENFVREYVAKH